MGLLRVLFWPFSGQATLKAVNKLIEEATSFLSENKIMQAQIATLQALNIQQNNKAAKDLLGRINSSVIPLKIKPGEIKIIPYIAPIPLSENRWVCERDDLPLGFLEREKIESGTTHLIVDTTLIASSEPLGHPGYKGLWDIIEDSSLPLVEMDRCGNRFGNSLGDPTHNMILGRRKSKEGGVEICITKTALAEVSYDEIQEIRNTFKSF